MNLNNHLPEERGYWLFFAIALLFAVITAFFQPMVAAVEAVAAVVVYLAMRGTLVKRNKKIIDYIRSRASHIEAATRGAIMNAPLPMVILQPDSDEIIWSNDLFLQMTGNPEHLYDTTFSDVIPNFRIRWVSEGISQAPEPVEVGKDQYLVFGNLIGTDNDSGQLAIMYFVNISHYVWVENDYRKSRPVAAILLIDNYEDLMRGVEESERSLLLTELNKKLSQWAESSQGMLLRYDRDHYLFLLEEAYLQDLVAKKFSVLDTVRQTKSPNAVNATLSIGIGKDGESFRDLYQTASLSLEMALSRGGDQVVIRDKDNFHFYGGKSKESERRTKVKSRVVANALSELFSKASQVFIMGHRFPDLDVIGAAAGVTAIARKRKVPAFIIKDPDPNPAQDMTERLEVLPEYESVFIDAEEAMVMVDPSSLVVVVDTNRPEQVQLPQLLEKGCDVIIIDHHRRAATYIDSPVLSFEDPYASSASELSVELMQHILEPGDLLRQEAEAVLSGIVLDTKNFTLRTGGRTFEAAAYLRRLGADTGEVRKLFQSDLSSARARYGLVQNAEIYRKEIAIAGSDITVDRIVAAKSADELLTISGIGASFVLFNDGHGGVIMSARSAGEINVQLILEDLGGGGNAAAAGAQVKNVTLEEAKRKLKDSINAYFEEA